MKKHEQQRIRLSEAAVPHIERLLSFLIPCAVMLIVLALNHKYPFGGEAALESDAGAQYYPFFLMIRRILHSGGSLLYSWRAGFGANVWALMAYYCINIWNLAAAFLPEHLTQGFLSLSVCVRIGFAGLSCAILMQTISRRRNGSVVLFAPFYGLSLWFIWNYFQLIWLDTAALLPLVLAGTVRLVRDGKCRMYPVMLLLSLLFNPYLSYITCCMTVLCWIALLFILKKPLKSLPAEAGRFFGCSLLAGGMAAVMLLPLAYAIRATGSAAQTMPDPLTVPYSFFALLGSLATMTYPVQHIGLPNIAGGMLCVLLLPAFLTAKRIPVRERIAGGLLLLFLLVSLWYQPLDYLWHGFHVPNGFIHRYAFLVPLVLLLAGWRFTDTLFDAPAESRRKQLLLSLPMLGFGLLVSFFGAHYDTTDVPLISVVLTVLYVLFCFGFAVFPRYRRAILAMLTVFFSIEMLLTNNWTISFLTVVYRAEQLAPVPETEKAVSAVRADADAAGRMLWRTAFPKGYGFNPELFYDLPFGGNLYSSLIPGALGDTCGKLGMEASFSSNYYFYHELPPCSMLMSGLQYIIAPDGAVLPDSMYRQLGDTAAYAFRYDVPAGFCLADTLQPEREAGETGIIDRQNLLFHQLTDSQKDVFVSLSPEESAADAVLEPLADDSFRFRTGSGERPKLTFSYTADRDGWYVYDILMDDAAAGTLRRWTVWLDDDDIAGAPILKDSSYDYSGYLSQIGAVKAGQEIRIELVFTQDTAGEVTVRAARMDTEAFEAGYEAMQQYVLTLSDLQDTALTGTVTTDDAHPLLYLSVPYDAGWHAEIDGVPADTEQAASGMLGIRLPAGTHTIRLRFFPQGLAAGCIISAVSILTALFLLLRKQSKSRK